MGGVGEGTEGEEHHHQAVAPEPGRDVGQQLLEDDEAEAGLEGTLHGAGPGGDHDHHEDQGDLVDEQLRVDLLLLDREHGARRCRPPRRTGRRSARAARSG